MFLVWDIIHTYIHTYIRGWVVMLPVAVAGCWWMLTDQVMTGGDRCWWMQNQT